MKEADQEQGKAKKRSRKNAKREKASKEPDNEQGTVLSEPSAEAAPEPQSLAEAPATPEEQENEAGDDLQHVVESLIFASREPLSVERLVKILGKVGKKRIQDAIDQVNLDYEATGRPFRVVEVAGGFQMLTAPEFAPWLSRLIKVRGEERLSRSALETLAIVAYKQPITRAEIEAIRGVQTSQSLKVLLDRNLIKIAGRAEILGRPMLYATTREFLDHFGLRSVKDLPKRSELLAG